MHLPARAADLLALRAQLAAQIELDELEATRRNADAIREQCKTLAGFVRAAWKYIDPADFVDNWHIEVICQHLEDVTFGRCRRLIINIPPRHMKSLLVSVAWPAWVWTLTKSSALSGPGVGFLSTSYAHSLSVRDNVKCRRLIESPWYKALWGERFALTGDQNTKIRFENNQGGYRIASSVDGTATGEGGSVVMFDDPLSAGNANSETARNGVNDWWDNTMSTRLNDPKTGAYVGVMQRLHEDDLVGHILAKESDWTVVCLPARYEPDHPHVYPADKRSMKGELLWPERVGETELVKLETSLGSYGTAGQLQQRPAPSGGGVFKASWWRYFKPEAMPRPRRIIQSWDTGFKAKDANDPSVCTTWADCDDDYYLIDLWRGKVEFPELKRTAVSLYLKHKPNALLIEDKASGQSLIQELKQPIEFEGQKVRLPILPIKVETDKVSRAYAITPVIEGGRAYLPDGAAWLADFTSELSQFPASAHDDQVDSVTQALAYLSREKATAAGFLNLVRDQNASKVNAEKAAVEQAAKRAAIQCPFAPGSVEYERFMAEAGA